MPVHYLSINLIHRTYILSIMKLKLIALLLCIASLPVFAQSPKEDVRFKGLDTAFQRVLKNWHAAGFAVAVVYKNKIIYAKGFGYRNVESKLPVTANTIFSIGSCTKAFTAVLTGKLQQDGKVDIDKPVRNYLPLLKFYNDNMNNTITLRDMMSHRTGLPRFDLSWYFFNTPSIDSTVERIRFMEPTYGVREKWQYNNYMFAAQGYLIEKLTGKSWGDNIKGSIFTPLGMDRSSVTVEEMQKDNDISAGYTIRDDRSIKKLDYYHILGMAPAGAINSTVLDMAKWVTAWINNGKYNGKEVIPADFRNEAISSQSILDGSLPGKEKPGIYFSNYGFGWFLDSYNGHYRVEHGGNIDGFSASTSFFPSDSLGIIVLSNQNNSLVPKIVRNVISDRMLGLKYHDWNSDLKNAGDKADAENDKARKAVTSVAKHNPATHPLANYTGLYTHPAFGTMKIYTDHDSLFAKTYTNTLWLRHGNYDVFEVFLKDPKEGIDTNRVYGINLQFHTSIGGDIDGLDTQLEGGLKPFTFTRSEEVNPVAVTAAGLQKYVGNYLLAGTVIKVYTKDNTLFVLVPGQPDYELVSVGNDKFALKVVSGYYLQFGPAGADKMTEAVFIQPNGNFKATRK
jgi:CubicO group peptidase (beta-lactamase class C family)